MGIHATYEPDTGVSVTLTIGAVLDPVRTTGDRNWSFDSLFGRIIEKDCPVIRESKIRLQQTREIGHSKPDPLPHNMDRTKGVAWDEWTVIPNLNLTSTYLDDNFSYRTYYSLHQYLTY